MRRHRASQDELCCSFCHKSQDVVGKLISSPSDYPRAYICPECVAVCNSILKDDRAEAPPTPHREDDSFWAHPLASELLDAVEHWAVLEKEGRDASKALTEMRNI